MNNKDLPAVYKYLTICLVILIYGVGGGGCDNYDDSELISKFQNIKRSTTVSYESMAEPLVLLWFSDIHNDIERLRRILRWKSMYSSYIDDILFTGDLTGLTYASLKGEIFLVPGIENVMIEIGNHDIYDYQGKAPKDKYSNKNYWAPPKAMYDQYMRYISKWNVVQPELATENNYYPCYYYKDYTESKIRLIVMDCIQYDSIEANWFKNVLFDAKEKKLSVIASQHYLQHNKTKNLIPFDTPFNSLDTSKLETKQDNGTLDIVDEFIEEGGIFICWLCGHFHSDFVGTYTNHPNQLYICIGSASISTPAQDCARVVGTISEDLFNIIGFDVYSKTISLFRMGAIYDHYLRKRETMTLGYEPPRLINTTY